MKHSEDIQARISALTSEIDVHLDGCKVELLARHLMSVLEANTRLNLTAITDPEAATVLHVVDSLVPVTELAHAPAGTFADIGSGGGFPAIPLSIATGRSAVMLESVGKKTAFLRDVALQLAIPAAALPERSEEHALVHREEYAAVTARAVADLGVLTELAAPLLQLGGRLVALKGEPSPEEYDRGDRSASAVGLARRGERRVELPQGAGTRTIVVYEKVQSTPSKFPRRPGMAAKRPLA